jgi:hypothetical protein
MQTDKRLRTIECTMTALLLDCFGKKLLCIIILRHIFPDIHCKPDLRKITYFIAKLQSVFIRTIDIKKNHANNNDIVSRPCIYVHILRQNLTKQHIILS